jgi:hypothetical protein
VAKDSTEKASSKTRIAFVFKAQLGVDAEMRCIIFETRQSWQYMTTSPKFALALYFFTAMAGSRWNGNSEESLHLLWRAKKPKPRACIVASHGSRTYSYTMIYFVFEQKKIHGHSDIACVSLVHNYLKKKQVDFHSHRYVRRHGILRV